MDRATIQDPRLVSYVMRTAEENDLPFQIRKPGGGGTNTGSIQTTAGGVSVATISCPGRYLHAPHSMINLNDYTNMQKLVDAVLRNLTAEDHKEKLIMNELIKKLVEAYGPSGFEDGVRELIRPEIEDFADEITVDPMGNLIARKNGDGTGLKVMIAAHMDEIGLMVSHITEKGFARVTNIGGIRTATLAGNRVQFADGTIGVVYSDNNTSRTSVLGLDKHYLDVGATSREDCPVKVGDAAGFPA